MVCIVYEYTMTNLKVVTLSIAIACATIVSAQTTNSTITVSGTSHQKVPSNQVTVTLGVQNQARSAGIAQNLTSYSENKVIKALQDLNVTNLRTEYMNLSPQYNYTDVQKLVGFTSSVSIVYNVQPDQVGKTIDSAIDAGANQVTSVTASVSDDIRTSVYKKALAAAVVDAQSKAQVVTKQIGSCMGNVDQVIIEPTTTTYQPPEPLAMAATMTTQSSTTFIPEDQDIVANVQVSYVVNQC